MNANRSSKSRRPIEREYIATLNATVSLEKWEAICKRAADDAIAGDHKSREWLAKWLLGTETRPLATLAAEEVSVAPKSAGDCEIECHRQKIDDDRRKVEHMRTLDPSLHLGPRRSAITN